MGWGMADCLDAQRCHLHREFGVALSLGWHAAVERASNQFTNPPIEFGLTRIAMQLPLMAGRVTLRLLRNT